jgi:hypothetical protein
VGSFHPCQGKSACRYDNVRCLTCGRTQQEIEVLRSLLDRLTGLAIQYDYLNVDEFADYVARKLIKSIEYRKQEGIKT